MSARDFKVLRFSNAARLNGSKIRKAFWTQKVYLTPAKHRLLSDRSTMTRTGIIISDYMN